MKKHSVCEYEELLRGLSLLKSADTKDCAEEPVSAVVFDSRKAGHGSLFFCKGEGFKEDYLKDAASAGALCYVSEKVYDVDLPAMIVSDVRKAMAECSWLCCNRCWESFPFIGITGTKGKSTTLSYIKTIVDLHCKKQGLKGFGCISTIETCDGIECFESHLTTPEAPDLARHFINAEESDLFAFGMEVSSQALKYDRSLGLEFDIGIFMNFGSDHIGESEHADIEDYFDSKLGFFDQVKTAVVNLDSERIERILPAARDGRLLEKMICFSPAGKESAHGFPADYIVQELRKNGARTEFTILRRSGPDSFEAFSEISLGMPGLFNAENALAAAIACAELGIAPEEIAEGLRDAKAAGRMEFFHDKSKDLIVISDYAHNELSFERVFSSAKKEFPGYRIEALFGCPGGKGFSRRTDLPKIAAKYADFVWITEEDPGFEDPMEISKVLQENLSKDGCPSRIIIDRAEAIRTAIEGANPRTVLLLLAKGREEYMRRGSDYMPVKSDSALAEELLAEM